MGPPSITPLIQIVTGHQHLRRQKRRLLTILNLHSALHHRDEGESVARPTSFLVTVLSSKVVAGNITPVEGFWKVGLWDLRSGFVPSGVFLSFIKDFSKFFIIGCSKFLGGFLFLGGLSGFRFLGYLSQVYLAVIWMTLRKFAGVSSPPQI